MKKYNKYGFENERRAQFCENRGALLKWDKKKHIKLIIVHMVVIMNIIYIQKIRQ